MRPFPLALLAVLVACSPRLPAAQEVPARSGPYTLEAVDESGRALPAWEHRGRTYVLGRLGQRYLLRFRNGTGRRVEVVASVDGRDAVDGRLASLAKRGYVVEPFGELSIDGFRVSADSVAAFRFSSVSRSYAARKGDARDVGVVGVAVFAERTQRGIPRPVPELARPDGAPGGARDQAERKADGAQQAEVSPPSATPPPSGLASAPRQRRAERPGLGTEFAEEHESRVEPTTFERASGRPDVVLTFRYDDREGLLAAGVDVDGRGRRDDEVWRRASASPFRGDPAFCEPPQGWRPGVR